MGFRMFCVSNCRFEERTLSLLKDNKFWSLLMANFGLNRRLALVLIDASFYLS